MTARVARFFTSVVVADSCTVLMPMIASAQPLAINAGGTGNTWGLPSQYAIVPNSSAGTTANKLAKYIYSGAIHTAQTATTSDTAVVGICVGATTCTTTGNATIQTGGYADCIFDGATTVGDFVQISTTSGGDCTDAGATAPTSGQVIGQVMTANTGAGTASLVQISLTPSTANVCSTCKCIPSSATPCETSWNTICSCNLGPFIHDPGTGNTWIDIDQNIIDFTNGTLGATALDFRLTADCNMHPNSDAHGLPASRYAAGTEYPNITLVGMLDYGLTDPLYPNSCSVSMQCESGATDHNFIVNPASTDSNGVPIGTAFLLKACAFDNR